MATTLTRHFQRCSKSSVYPHVRLLAKKKKKRKKKKKKKRKEHVVWKMDKRTKKALGLGDVGVVKFPFAAFLYQRDEEVHTNATT